jgi:DNA-binding MarR family transcriptional regulator
MPTAESLSLLIEDFLLGLMHRTDAHAMNHFANRDLALPQIRILCALAANSETVPISDVAHGLDLSLATAGRNIDRLVHEGLVDRQEDPADRRVKRVALTEAGQELMRSQLEARREGLLAFSEHLTLAERQSLHAALTTIVEGHSLRTNQGHRS